MRLYGALYSLWFWTYRTLSFLCQPSTFLIAALLYFTYGWLFCYLNVRQKKPKGRVIRRAMPRYSKKADNKEEPPGNWWDGCAPLKDFLAQERNKYGASAKDHHLTRSFLLGQIKDREMIEAQSRPKKPSSGGPQEAEGNAAAKPRAYHTFSDAHKATGGHTKDKAKTT
ncbi:unnamed protein product [Vitrella brassicaformis CCMP3155]|uniref:Uncharacterized protein n=1 Tax=Vitrella brassicaformis (strain CCMP3155) TaxID=1169540 RepID=A0A0G4EWI9_VITBC|nr:unnamed protein product [Vitrella brassicaformis CCMP3155]|eukprot:CEM03332.1 unnamed protein product [Vitrella brassicaformis CCMP3155]